MGYQNNKLGMLTGFGTTSSYHLDATDYDATGQDEGTTVGAYGDQLIQEYDYDQATSRLISGVTDLQTDASGAEDTTSYTHNQAGDVTSIQDAEDAGTTSATTDLQCFAYNDLHELTTAWTDNGTQDPAPTSPNPGGIGGCTNPHPGRLDHRRPGTVLEHFGEPALRSTAR